jgi:hypothetical protein
LNKIKGKKKDMELQQQKLDKENDVLRLVRDKKLIMI